MLYKARCLAHSRSPRWHALKPETQSSPNNEAQFARFTPLLLFTQFTPCAAATHAAAGARARSAGCRPSPQMSRPGAPHQTPCKSPASRAAAQELACTPINHHHVHRARPQLRTAQRVPVTQDCHCYPDKEVRQSAERAQIAAPAAAATTLHPASTLPSDWGSTAHSRRLTCRPACFMAS